jgi:hypothetical protein
VPIFVLSRREDGIDTGQWPPVTYEPDVGTAMTQASRAVGDKNVLVHGARTAQLALAASILDERGVCRVHEMSIKDGEWKLWREGEPFAQRFSATERPSWAAGRRRWTGALGRSTSTSPTARSGRRGTRSEAVDGQSGVTTWAARDRRLDFFRRERYGNVCRHRG